MIGLLSFRGRWMVMSAVAVVTFGGAVSGRADGEEPASPSAVAVPSEHAALGRVLYLQPSDKPQVTFTSNARAEKFKGASDNVSGYVVASTKEGATPVEFVAGEFRLPVASLDTGNPKRNEHMLEARWFNAKVFPDIVFKLSRVEDVKTATKTDGSVRYLADLVGTMTILDKSVELTARCHLMAPNPESAETGPLSVACSFDVELAAFGMGVDDPGIEAGKIAKKMKIQTSLTLAADAPSTP